MLTTDLVDLILFWYDSLTLCVPFAGCFVHGLFLEGGAWDMAKGCITYQQPKQLVSPLPIIKVIPIETHRLKLQVITKINM